MCFSSSLNCPSRHLGGAGVKLICQIENVKWATAMVGKITRP